MNNSIRTQLLTTLAELSLACPQMRFGQLIANLSTLANGSDGNNQWDVDDEELLRAARQQLEYFVEHRSPNCNAASDSTVEPRA